MSVISKKINPEKRVNAREDILIDKDGRPHKKEEEIDGKIVKTVYGIRFPWECLLFVAVGAASEVVDAMFMGATLDLLAPTLESWQNMLISAIVGAGCFFSMAFVGFQLGNPRFYSKFGERISYAFWICAGIALVTAKLLAGIYTGGLDKVLDPSIEYSLGDLIASRQFISNTIIAVVQLVLYIGTGFITRDSVRIITDNDMCEYQLAKREYIALLDELAKRRKQIYSDISKLRSYHKYAERLVRSRKNVSKNVKHYNSAARALIEAKMSITVDPDLMAQMYDRAMEKEEKLEHAK